MSFVTFSWNSEPMTFPTTQAATNFNLDWYNPKKYVVRIFVKVPSKKSPKQYFEKAWSDYTGGTPETEEQFYTFFGGKNNVLVFFFQIK